jgi:hypothetical protein
MTDISLPFTPENKHELRTALNNFALDKERAIARYGNIDTWITTKVTDMSYIFTGLDRQYTFNNHDDIISNWDTSNVTTMRGLFTSTHEFNQPLYWNTSKVEDMSYLFSHCERFDKTLEWDTSNVKTMRQMFFYCLRFNQSLHLSDTSNVENMDNMFTYCRKMNQDLTHLQVDGVVNFDPEEMFRMSPLSPNVYRKEWFPAKKY